MDEIRDGDEYALTFPPHAHACILYPASRFDAARCPPGAKATDTVPGIPADVRLLTIATVQVGEHDDGRRAQLTLWFNKMRHAYGPVPRTVDAFAKGIVRSVAPSLPGATVRGEPGVQLLDVHGLPMARITYDTDGLTGTYAHLAHAVTYAVWSPEGGYVCALNSVASAAEATDALADEIAGSVRIAHLAGRNPSFAP